MSCFAPVIATYNSRSMLAFRDFVNAVAASRSADVDDRLRDLVGRRDHLRVRLEIALRGDHVDELLGQVDVRRFERARLNQAEAAGTRRAADGVAGAEGLAPRGVAELAQA